jgi:tRNA U34 2-thiouridine synthase MnmA/TrmU
MVTKVPQLVKSVACVLNGTVESAVTAYYLQSKGYPVTGVSLHNIYQHAEDLEKQRRYAVDVCHHLSIPHADVKLPDNAWAHFNDALHGEYKKGLNPDVNVYFTKLILTTSLLHHCTREMRLASVALPFFARSDHGFDSPLTHKIQGTRLLKSIDVAKDETFFLCQTPGKYLQRCVFPLGELPKEAVEMMASLTALDTIPAACSADESLVDTTLLPPDVYTTHLFGNIVDLMSGKTIATHQAFHEYYAGHCVEISGQKYYVCEKNVKSGDVYVVDDPNHPACFTDTFFTSLANWIHKTPYAFYHEKQMMDCAFRLHKDGALVNCSITVGALNEYCGNDHIIVSSSQPVHNLIPGQFCAFYSGEECLGSASIFKPGPSHYAMNYKKYRKETTRNGSWKGWFS